MQKIYLILFIFFISTFKICAKEITNLSWNKSVAKGKKLSNFRETVTSPALGKKHGRLHYYLRIAEETMKGIIQIAKIMVGIQLLVMEVVIEQEVNFPHLKNLLEKNGIR